MHNTHDITHVTLGTLLLGPDVAAVQDPKHVAAATRHLLRQRVANVYTWLQPDAQNDMCHPSGIPMATRLVTIRLSPSTTWPDEADMDGPPARRS